MTNTQTQPHVDSLISLIGEELAIYTELRDVLAEELTALLGMDAAVLGMLASRKETLALRLRGLDESRKLIAQRLARVLGVPGDAVTITRLCGVMGGVEAQRLGRVAEQLKALVMECQAANEKNSQAARKGLELASASIQYLLGAPDPAGKVYQPPKGTARGYAAAGMRPAGSGPGLISRQI